MQYYYNYITSYHPLTKNPMNPIRRLTVVTTAAATILFLALLLVLSSVLPVYEFPNYGYSALMLSGSLAAFHFARRRIACR